MMSRTLSCVITRVFITQDKVLFSEQISMQIPTLLARAGAYQYIRSEFYHPRSSTHTSKVHVQLLRYLHPCRSNLLDCSVVSEECKSCLRSGESHTPAIACPTIRMKLLVDWGETLDRGLQGKERRAARHLL